MDETKSKATDMDTIDVAHYFTIVKRNSLRILLLAVAFTILVALFVFRMTPIYSSSATILVDSENTNLVSIEEVYGFDSNRKDYMQTQFEILRSRQIAERTVRKLALHKNASFMPDENDKDGITLLKEALKDALPFFPQEKEIERTEEEQEELDVRIATNKLMRSLNLSLISKTQVMVVTVNSDIPKLSAMIANAVADEYIDNYLLSKLEMTSKATEFLTESLDGLKRKLIISENRLADFFERNQVVNLHGVVGLAADELEGLSEQLLDAQNALKLNETIYRQTQTNNSIEGIASLPEVLNHPTIQGVRRDEAKAMTRVSELSKVYGPKHPNMIAANAELNSIRETLATQTRDLVSSINKQYLLSKERVELLKAQVEQAKANYRRLSTLENERLTLQREVDINQQLYDSFFTRLKETDELGGFETANARILDKAIVPSVPSKPNKKLLIAMAFIFSIGFGVFVAILMDTLNSGINSVDDVEKKLGQRMLGLIPWLPHKKKTDLPVRSYFDSSKHQFSEALRTLRTSLSLLNLNKEKQAVMVTSSVPKEGKTTVSLNLAFAFGQLKKTVVVDADLRRPSIGKMFNIPVYQPGVANLILKTHTVDECVVTDEESGIDVITAGTVPSNPQELLADTEFATLIEKLKKTYDFVVLDTAPTQAVSDSMIVAECADSIVYVVRADATSDKVINSGIGRLLQVGHRVDGVVLNQVDLRKSDVSQKYAGFYDQYGYTSENS
ncbi:polysaccharide biosynthesis tyrosine autokinase [Alteromonas sp. 345S023]|uniref:non-specific protein-tyrosine kinase n=2 Tax=Alteromonas profundi TaxID=2696062 RepID=A0A7X5LII2_9ALTE|nr:polysaccharide biosynthesis tyrosine autokinase [Alteromonas profundi]NDV89948.1 polysaccharide biosynthesis tyrosine autokinase [Alteromonas profundi]